MSETSRSSFSGAKVRTFLECDPQVSCYDQLSHALAVLHLEGLVAVVDEQHAYLAAVVGVDGAWARPVMPGLTLWRIM